MGVHEEVAIAFIAASVWALPSPALADDVRVDRDDFRRDGSVETGYSTEEPGEGRVVPSPVSAGSDDGLVWVGLPTMGQADDGDLCIDYRWVQLSPDEVDGAQREAWGALDYVFDTLPELAGMRVEGDCAADPAQELPPQLVGAAVREVVIDQLPRPQLSVPPGYALTGMPAYLVTGHALEYGPVVHGVDLEIMELSVEVTGTATTTVDWGDGTEPATYTQPGRPYPEGEVRHAYVDKGVVDIQVTDSWRLSYDVSRGGTVIISDAIEFDLDPVTLTDLEIRELRTVRTTTE